MFNELYFRNIKASIEDNITDNVGLIGVYILVFCIFDWFIRLVNNVFLMVLDLRLIWMFVILLVVKLGVFILLVRVEMFF